MRKQCNIGLTPEQVAWLEETSQKGEALSAVLRRLINTVMDDDQREHRINRKSK